MADQLTPEHIKSFLDRYRDPADARKFLQDAGLIDEDGKLSAPYRKRSLIPATDWDYSPVAEVEFSEWFHGDYDPFSLRSDYFYGDCKVEDVKTLEKLMFQWIHVAFVTGYERGTVSRTPEGGLPPLLSE
jgi:hypothetical protein